MYRAKNMKTGQWMIKVADPKTKFGGDVGAYWKYTYDQPDATVFTCYCDAEMAGIMLNNDRILVVDMEDQVVARQTAIDNKTFHSVRV